MKINNNFDLSKALSLGDLAPLSSRIKELESLFGRLADINKQLIEQQLQIASNPKIAEVVKLTGLSRSTIRSKVVNGDIMKLEASSVGVTLIPRTEVERLLNFKDIKTEKNTNDKMIFEAITKQEIVGISLSKKKIKKMQNTK